MSFHEGSNWQANKEDKKEPLYKPEIKAPERTFTLADMIECWEAAAKRTWHDHLVDQVDAPDKKQYFKSKEIDLP